MIYIMVHYTYLIVFPTIPQMYIGVRSYNGQPLHDDYRSSSKKVKELIARHHPYTLRVIAEFQTRREAENNEIALHEIFDVARNPYFLNGAKARPGGFSRAGVVSEWRGRTYEQLFGEEEAKKKKDNLRNKLKGRTFSAKTLSKMSMSHADVSGAKNPRSVNGKLELDGKILLEYETKAELADWCFKNNVPHRPLLKLRFGEEYRPNLSSRNSNFKKWFGLRVLESRT